MTTATRIAADSANLHRSAKFQPASWNAAERTLDLIWTTGAAVTRFDFLDGDFYDETLSTDASAVRLGRLNDGAPLLLDHIARAEALIGSVVPGSARIVGGNGIATVRLTEAADMADHVAKVIEGHLRNVSVGYAVHKYQRREGGDRAELRAIDWEPHEITLTPVPADPGCQIRSRSPDPMPAEIVDDDNEPVVAQRGRPISVDMIRSSCERGDYSRAFERELLEEHAERPFTRNTLQARLTAEYARMTNPAAIDNSDFRLGRGGNGDRAGGMGAAIGDALYARMSGNAPSEPAREFMGASMVDLARGLMEQRGERVRWESPSRLMARFGAHTTSDFPNLLQAATGRYLLELYQGAPSPLKVLARNRTVSDFRQINSLAMLPVGILRPVAENAEFKRVSITEGQNGYRLTTFGEIFTLSRQAFINDDLGYFANIAQLWARAASETEATQLAGLITGNGPQMGDAQPLYSAVHGNLSASGDAINVASLSAARLAMRAQKNFDGATPAGVVPRYLVVGPAKETEAEQALAALSAVATPSGINPFSGKLELIVEPRIPGNSWRLFSDPSVWPTLEYAQLAGEEGVFTDTRIGFDVDGFDFKARIDFGAGPVDWRGTYKNPGN